MNRVNRFGRVGRAALMFRAAVFALAFIVRVVGRPATLSPSIAALEARFHDDTAPTLPFSLPCSLPPSTRLRARSPHARPVCCFVCVAPPARRRGGGGGGRGAAGGMPKKKEVLRGC